MDRRRFIKGSMAMAAVCGTSGIASLFSQAAFAADSDIADGQTQRFDFSRSEERRVGKECQVWW